MSIIPSDSSVITLQGRAFLANKTRATPVQVINLVWRAVVSSLEWSPYQPNAVLWKILRRGKHYALKLSMYHTVPCYFRNYTYKKIIHTYTDTHSHTWE